MPGRRSTIRFVALIAITAFSVFVVSGCAWLGKGMEVSNAYNATKEAKTGAYLASLEITAPKRGKQARIEEYYAASGAFDVTDPDHPKSHGEVSIDGDTYAFVEPGNGRVYLTEDGKTEYVKIPKEDRPEGKENGETMLEAAARAVINFQDAPPITNGVGKPIPAISAEVSRTKLCGESLRAVAREINNSELNEGDLEFRMTNRDVRAATRWCAKQMPSVPSLTFGLENGLLTDFVLDGSVRFGKRTITIQAKLQLTGLNQPQTGFIPPKGSKKSKDVEFGAAAVKASDRLEELLDSLPSLP